MCYVKLTVPIDVMKLVLYGYFMVKFSSSQQNTTQEKFIHSRFKYSYSTANNPATSLQTVFQHTQYAAISWMYFSEN